MTRLDPEFHSLPIKFGVFMTLRSTLFLCGLLASLPVLAADAPAAAAKPATLPISIFTQEATFSNPKLSPDGKHIAINVRIMRNGRMTPTMTIYTLPELKIVSTIAMNKFEMPLDFVWATNRRLIVAKGIEVGLREAPRSTGEVVAVNLDGSEPEYLYGRDNFRQSSKGDRYLDDHGWGRIVGIPRVRDGHVFIGAREWSRDRSILLDINSNKSGRKSIADIPVKGLGFALQNDDTPRFAYGSDDDNLAILYRFDDSSKKWNQVPKDQVGAEKIPFGFSADDKEAYFLHSAKGEPLSFIKESMPTGTRTEIAKDAFGDIGRIQWTEKPAVPFAVGTNAGVPSVRYLDPASPNAVLHKTLSQQFPDSLVSFINFTDDGSKLLFYVYSDRDPGSYFLYDKKSGAADLLFAAAPEIDPDLMAERRPIRFKARDGLDIAGYFTFPKGADPAKQKLPMIVLPHGGPHNSADRWSFDTHAQFLASRGYAVLQVNFRGSGGRGLNFEHAGYRQWGGKIQDDIIDGVKWAIGQGEVDAKRICTYGISFGAYSALMLPIREPGMFKCAVGYAGVFDLAYVFKEDNVKVHKSSINFFTKTLGTDQEELTRFSPNKQADKVKVPVFLIHGGQDEVSPIEHAKRMRAALIQANNTPDWLEEPDEGHGFYDKKRQLELYQKLEAFFAKHLGK
jgi:dienelactone hydrolase